MSQARIVAQHTTCAVCERTLAPGFQYHFCDGEYVVTLNGQFHSYAADASSARTYIYRTARRQEAAGMVVAIMPAAADATDDDASAYDDYYGQDDDEPFSHDASEEAAYTDAMMRLRTLGAEQAAHEESVRAADAAPLVISLIETPVIRRAA
jgi:hypothetical protein